MIKHIIFDVYGTLISTGTGSLDAVRKILAKRSRLDIDPKEFYSSWKKYYKHFAHSTESFMNEAIVFTLGLRRLYADYNVDGDADEDVNIMLASLVGRNPFPETEETVNALRKLIPVYIGSNTDTEPLMTNLSSCNMSFDGIFTSEMLMCYKPNKDFFTQIISNLGISPEHTLFVGDSLNDDIFGPKQIGMQTCWVNRKNELSADIKPDYEIKDLSGLIDICSK